MFFLHPKSEVEKESNEFTNRFFKYLGFGVFAIAMMRLSPKLLRRD